MFDISSPHHDQGSLPHRDGGRAAGPGPNLHHHVSLGARFPSSVCVRLARQRLSRQPGQQPSQSNSPNPEESLID